MLIWVNTLDLEVLVAWKMKQCTTFELLNGLSYFYETWDHAQLLKWYWISGNKVVHTCNVHFIEGVLQANLDLRNQIFLSSLKSQIFELRKKYVMNSKMVVRKKRFYISEFASSVSKIILKICEGLLKNLFSQFSSKPSGKVLVFLSRYIDYRGSWVSSH